MSLFRKIWQVNKIGARQYSAFGILAIAPIILQGNKTGRHVYRTIYLAKQILEIIFRIGYIEPYRNNFISNTHNHQIFRVGCTCVMVLIV